MDSAAVARAGNRSAVAVQIADDAARVADDYFLVPRISTFFPDPFFEKAVAVPPAGSLYFAAVIGSVINCAVFQITGNAAHVISAKNGIFLVFRLVNCRIYGRAGDTTHVAGNVVGIFRFYIVDIGCILSSCCSDAAGIDNIFYKAISAVPKLTVAVADNAARIGCVKRLGRNAIFISNKCIIIIIIISMEFVQAHGIARRCNIAVIGGVLYDRILQIADNAAHVIAAGHAHLVKDLRAVNIANSSIVCRRPY